MLGAGGRISHRTLRAANSLTAGTGHYQALFVDGKEVGEGGEQDLSQYALKNGDTFVSPTINNSEHHGTTETEGQSWVHEASDGTRTQVGGVGTAVAECRVYTSHINGNSTGGSYLPPPGYVVNSLHINEGTAAQVGDTYINETAGVIVLGNQAVGSYVDARAPLLISAQNDGWTVNNVSYAGEKSSVIKNVPSMFGSNTTGITKGNLKFAIGSNESGTGKPLTVDFHNGLYNVHGGNPGGDHYFDIFTNSQGIQIGCVNDTTPTGAWRYWNYGGSSPGHFNLNCQATQGVWRVGTAPIWTYGGYWSDERMKFSERVLTSDECVDLVKKLKPRHYSRVDVMLTPEQEAAFEAGEPNPLDPIGAGPKPEPYEEYGFIAQDWETTPGFENLVNSDSVDGAKRIQLVSVIPMCVGSIQKLFEEIETLKAQVAALQA